MHSCAFVPCRSPAREGEAACPGRINTCERLKFRAFGRSTAFFLLKMNEFTLLSMDQDVECRPLTNMRSIWQWTGVSTAARTADGVQALVGDRLSI